MAVNLFLSRTVPVDYFRMNKRTNFTYKKKLIVFSIILFIIKLIILPFIHEIDADGVSRVYLSLQFANNPFIINTGNWPPIFFYIMGVALKVYDNQFVTPVLVNILFSVFLLFPLFIDSLLRVLVSA